MADRERLKEIHRALLSAFPQRSEIEQMVRFELSTNLAEITTGSSLSDTVFELLIWAEAKGQLGRLLDGALTSNPTNADLRACILQDAKGAYKETNTRNRSLDLRPVRRTQPQPEAAPRDVAEAYLRAQRRYVETRLGDYIDPGARFRNGTPFNASAWFQRSDDAARVTYVTGEYGCGKTTFCHRWLLHLCEDASRTPEIVSLPILVNLTDLEMSVAEVEAIAADSAMALDQLFEIAPPVVQLPSTLKSPFIVFLEGLDEVSNAAAAALFAKVLEIASLDERGSRFVISTRINSLRLHVHKMKLELAGVAGQRFLPTRENTVDIPQLDTARKEQFLRLRIPSPVQRQKTLDYLWQNPNLHELASRPLIMDLLTDQSAGEESVLERLMNAGVDDREMSLACVFDFVVQHHFDRLDLSDDGQRVARLRLALARIAYHQLRSPVITQATLIEELAAVGVSAGEGANDALALLRTTFLMPHSVLPGQFIFQFRAYRDYFIATYLQNLANLAEAVLHHTKELQSFFCHRGILDFLREMVGESHKEYLRKLLQGDTEQLVLASHLTRRACFQDLLPDIEAAFQRCDTIQGKIFLIFSILSHIDNAHPRYLEYTSFIQGHVSEFRLALKLFVEGVEKDVLAFNLERLNHPQHRRKAPLYLISLTDPAISAIDPTRTVKVVERFLSDASPNSYEVELARSVLAVVSSLLLDGGVRLSLVPPVS